MSAKVTILPNGPALIAGDFTVIGVDGNPLQLPSPQMAVCRCGQSKVKPFCDGSHRPAGFKDPIPAV